MSTSILLVDDDPITRRVIERVITTEPRLRAMDARVVPAPDGEQGLALLETERPDLVITDLYMPGMDGVTFCREVRRSRAGQGLPILMISGVYDGAQLGGALTDELGATFLAKPVAATALVEAILAAVPTAGAAAAAGNGSMAGAGAVRGQEAVPRVPVKESDTVPTPAPPADGPGGGSRDAVPADSSITTETAAVPSGSLAERGVPRLLFEHMEAASTGVLTLLRAQMRKEIFLRRGNAVSADSNLRQEALGSLLVAKGAITEQQLQFLLAEIKRRGQKMGSVLVELGWLTPEEVLQYLAAQARKRIVDCLRWRDGTWTFVPGDSFGERVMEHDLDTARIVFKGLLRTATVEEMVSRFDEDGARPVRLLPQFEKYRAPFQAVFGTEVLPLLAQGATLGSLVLRENGQSLAMAVEALLTSGLAELEPLGVSMIEPSSPRETLEPFPLDRLGSAPRPGPARILWTPAEEVRPEAEAAWQSAPLPPSDGVPALSRAGEREESGAIRLFSPARTTQLGMGPLMLRDGRSRPSDARTALLREYLELHGKTHYEVLGVRPDASADEITRAYEDKRDRLAPEAIAGSDLDADSSKLESLRGAYDRAFRVLGDPEARREYDAPPSADQVAAPKDDALGAELAFGEGLRLLQSGQGAKAARHFERAVDARPDQAAYHAYLGWSLYQADAGQNVPAARERLEHALALDPDLAKAHELLGRLALDDGDLATARIFLERAAELDPVQPDVVAMLVGVFQRLAEPRAAERCYRRIIASLGERALPLRQRLWRELAELYEHKLGERESARIAYDMAARLSPSDLAMQRKVVQLNAEDPGRWRDITRALAAEWQQRPADRALGAGLTEMLLRAGHHDAATVVAAVAVLRGDAGDELVKLAQEGRPRLLRRLATPLELSVIERVSAAGEDELLEALFTLLVTTDVLEGLDLEQVDLHPGARLEVDELPVAFRRVLRYVCELLGREEPQRLYQQTTLGGSARLIDLRPAALVVGPPLLESSDTVELGFRLGRALALGTPGKVAAVSRSGRQLRPYLLASLATARGSTTELDPPSQQILTRIQALDPGLRKQLAAIGTALTEGRQLVDVGGWVRASNRTATRLAMLVCGDVLRVGRTVAQDDGPEALADLLAFALCTEHLDLREELGISAVV